MQSLSDCESTDERADKPPRQNDMTKTPNQKSAIVSTQPKSNQTEITDYFNRSLETQKQSHSLKSKQGTYQEEGTIRHKPPPSDSGISESPPNHLAKQDNKRERQFEPGAHNSAISQGKCNEESVKNDMGSSSSKTKGPTNKKMKPGKGTETKENKSSASGSSSSGRKDNARRKATYYCDIKSGSEWQPKVNDDLKQYQDGYPRLNGQKPNPRKCENKEFYFNEIQSAPDGDYIENIHKKWHGDYTRLERHHGYIQWLFPIREEGVNYRAQVLQLHEIEAIKKDPDAFKRVRRSYEMMLDFYGMKLVNEEGKIERAENWEERYRNLNRSSHNYLRITRILKCLGELGYEGMKFHFVNFVLDEIFNGELLNTCQSCIDYWLQTLRDDPEHHREQLVEKVKIAITNGYIDTQKGSQGFRW